MKHTVSLTDIIYATLTLGGRLIANIRISGVASLSEIYEYVRRAAGAAHGLLTVRLRNSSRGWQHEHSLLMRAA